MPCRFYIYVTYVLWLSVHCIQPKIQFDNFRNIIFKQNSRGHSLSSTFSRKTRQNNFSPLQLGISNQPLSQNALGNQKISVSSQERFQIPVGANGFNGPWTQTQIGFHRDNLGNGNAQSNSNTLPEMMEQHFRGQDNLHQMGLTPQVSFNQSLTLMPSVRTALNDLLFSFIGSPSKRKVAQYNAKQYLPEYRRFYWIGERYYIQDLDSALLAYITCTYSIPPEMNVFYENEDRVGQIIFQCVKFQERCCGLDCCSAESLTRYRSSSSSVLVVQNSLYVLIVITFLQYL